MRTFLYSFLLHFTDSYFCRIVHWRLHIYKMNRLPISLFRLARADMSKIIVVVGKVTGDVQLPVIPKMIICALQFSEREHDRVVKAEGSA